MVKQLQELAILERAIYEAGVDGGMATGAAIEELRCKEAEYGVEDPNAKTPRWQK